MGGGGCVVNGVPAIILGKPQGDVVFLMANNAIVLLVTLFVFRAWQR
jgi:hypothetical protein